MAPEAIEGRTITLKIKATTFEVRTRAATLPHYISSAADMMPPLTKLLQVGSGVGCS
ncbi:hypothetical protein MNEG_9879 [Monoraphidium neglectum]|uniref:DNA polymerase Y-family little finger domain-containing protein n=1 Tax=Monoraphidium neglectum TaxID=145388 RepID=A0A0D2M3C7_9CHLO|nr:hypothetical protein MNEG_9879 [Monoraphidium neglectum]KIY98079.1 hypothetical protein MNEG_9879 [Monoraphidium neglectum]|eukprot:XP_013897099.1 hypothetical protein MNEG_9879 [Monoraphidium neglectum]